MRNYTDFGTEIRIGLARKGMKVGELCSAVSKRTGLYCDTSYISKISRGINTSPRVIEAIREILEIGGIV